MRPLGAAGFSLSSLFLPFFSQKKTNVTGNRVSQVLRFLFAATSLPPRPEKEERCSCGNVSVL